MKFNIRNFHEISIKKTLFIPLFKLVQHLEIMSIFLETNSKGLVLSSKKKRKLWSAVHFPHKT